MIPIFDINYLRKYKDPLVDLFIQHIKDSLPDLTVELIESTQDSSIRKYAILLPANSSKPRTIRTLRTMLNKVSKSAERLDPNQVKEIKIEVIISESIQEEREALDVVLKEGYTVLYVKFEGRDQGGFPLTITI